METEKIGFIETWMFRNPREFITLFFSLAIVVGLGYLLFSFSLYAFIGLLLSGLIITRLQQATYLGNAIRVHEHQFPHIYEIAKKHAEALNTPWVSIYIVQDPTLNAFTIGFFSATIVLHSALVEQLDDEELEFVIGHEFGHVKAGHNKILSLISPTGQNVFFSNYIFSFWQRNAEYSADKCGLILTKKIDPAITSMMKLSVGGSLFKKLNVEGYISQMLKANISSVKLGELLVDHPLITNRIRELVKFFRENFKEVQKDETILHAAETNDTISKEKIVYLSPTPLILIMILLLAIILFASNIIKIEWINQFLSKLKM